MSKDNCNIMHELDCLSNVNSFSCSINVVRERLPPLKPLYSMISQNIRSVYKNSDDLSANLTLLSHNVDIIILTECILKPDIPIPTRSGYSAHCTTFQVTQNDGVVVYINSSLQHKVKEIVIADASCLEVTLSHCTLLCIYRSPSNKNTKRFRESLDCLLKDNKYDKNVLIIGDININIMENHGSNYLRMLADHDLTPGHRLNTRINTCVDHVITNIDPKLSASIAVLETTITDHLMTLINIYSSSEQTCKTNTKIVTDFMGALDTLRSLEPLKLLKYDEPEYLAQEIINLMNASLTINTKTVKIPHNKRLLKPWITTGILKCINNRNKLQKQLKQDPNNTILQITYRRYRNYCSNLLKKLKKQYETNQLAKSKNNNKLLWNTIKSITNQNTTKSKNQELLNIGSSEKESSDLINEHFINVGKTLAEEIVNQSITNTSEALESIIDKPCNSIGLIEPDPSEIDTVIMGLKSDSASGWDNIPTKFVKLAKNDIIPVLHHLFSLCFKKGCFPQVFKRAVIHPVYKSGDRGSINNYRPIAVLSVLSKILEKLINKRLVNFIEKYHIISDSQFGFREGKSTEDAVLALTSKIVNLIDKKKKSLCIFLDLKKAFDTVSVPILLKKLEKLGIRGPFHDIVSDYLSNRSQIVKLEKHILSNVEPTLLYGVPQGSVLGPTLFLLYLNDLATLKLHNASIISYADDTALLFHGLSWAEVYNTAEVGLQMVIKWLKRNLLTLNTEKTNYMTFSILNRFQPPNYLHLTAHGCNNYPITSCNCSALAKVSYVKYLGIYIDQQLNWHKQIENCTARVRKLLWLFKYLRHVSDRKLLIQIYKTLVQSVITYCLPIWGGSHKTQLIRLERAQRCLLKVLLLEKYTYSTVKVYEDCNLLTVRQLYIFLCILKTHKNMTPDPIINAKRNPYNVIPNLNTHTKFSRNQFHYKAISLYNKINRILHIYNMSFSETKKTIFDWLRQMDYTETENVLNSEF